ncbi:MAG: magnesium transporter [Clostridiales bacterium]|nr:magnesium transporter [Clostridiales bacterium]
MERKNFTERCEQILQLLHDRDLANLKSLLAQASEIEIINILTDLSPEEQVIVFRLLGKEDALSVFEQLDTDLQQNLLRSFTEEKAIEFVNEMAPDDRVRLFDEMPASVTKKLLNSLSQQEREITNVLMGYEEETAGRIMTTEFISLRRNMNVAQAMEKVRRQAPDKESVYTLYVTDDVRMLEGVLSLKDLICAYAGDHIEDIMHSGAISVTTDTDQEEVARKMQDLDLLAIPVVDSEGRMVGIVTIDDAIDILEEETTEDIFDSAGLADVSGESDRSEVLIYGSLWKIWRVRLPILLITLAFGFFSGFIIDGFEDTLEAIAVVAVFIPLIMGMSGNVGTQSSTVFARGVVLGHIQMKNFLKHFAKEIGVGLSIGAVIGAATGIVAWLWQGEPMLGLAVGLALVVAITVASLLGFLVPFVLIKLKIDQAAGSAPIITSIKDIVGLAIYFVLVTILLGNML